MRLSVAPGDVQRMLAGIREHPGMESISFSPITRSVLARFNPHEISREEIVLRIAFHLSLDCGSAPFGSWLNLRSGLRWAAAPRFPPPCWPSRW